MSASSPWVALSVDWMDSEMFDDTPASTRLAWVCLLCHVKAVGRGGRAKMRQKSFAKVYQLSERAVDEMVKNARAAGAIQVDGGVVTLCNWGTYQHGKKVWSSCQIAETPQTTQTPPTIQITDHNTDHRSQEQKQEQDSLHVVHPGDVDRIWKAYPHKVGKKAGITAIKAAIKRGSAPDWLIAQIGRYEAATRRIPGRAWKQAQGWFNDDRFAEEAVQAVEQEARNAQSNGRQRSVAQIQPEPGKYDHITGD